MTRNVTIAAIQMSCADSGADNVDKAERMIRAAAGDGANVILPQELFDGVYFCQNERPRDLDRAAPVAGHPTVERMRVLARELGVVIPVSVYELSGQARFNSVAVVDADGSVLGVYRKSHIPHGSGYQEKYYFSPGDTGFRVWDTAFGRVGVGICWDQWFPECARAMALLGAEMLLYPTAIGSELFDPAYDSAPHWRRVMQGHAGANLMPVAAANRVGTEPGADGTELTFYGTSFIAGPTGEIVADADRSAETAVVATFDLDEAAAMRRFWGVYRDRRPDLYGPLATLDGGGAPS